MVKWTFAAAAMLAAAGSSVHAQGNLASQLTELEISIDGVALAFSQTEFELETGKYYRLAITSDGTDEYLVQAPELFRNSWINQVVINDLEVKTNSLYGVEFDDEGTILIYFIPVRTGNFEMFVPGQQERGLSATFVVR